jgi:prepilin-type N-terminal cleavage/methylation domain-containing protein
LNKGFTLIELAIVIVVVGLITAGVVGGSSLIESSKRQQQLVFFENVNRSALAFKLEYNAIPGDIKDAWDYWGDDCGANAGQCNGNGDKVVNSNVWDGYLYHVNKERCMFWKHMALAGIWKEKYPCEGTIMPDNAPINSLNPDTHYMVSAKCPPGNTNTNCNSYDKFIKTKNYLFTSGKAMDGGNTVWVRCNWYKAFTPQQMKFFDKKIDDGKPQKGKLVVTDHTGSTCGSEIATSASPCLNDDNDYDLSNDEHACQMRLELDF